ncbi:response regulator [Streptomyces sp. TRM70350]|nr:response regulator [Streptomyces sp. TRM70350]
MDDEPDGAYGVSTVLRYQGRQVRGAPDGYAAVAVAGQFQPDAVVMDVLLPDGDGLEAARRIRAARPGVRVLFLTACDAADAGIPADDACLTKPVPSTRSSPGCGACCSAPTRSGPIRPYPAPPRHLPTAREPGERLNGCGADGATELGPVRHARPAGGKPTVALPTIWAPAGSASRRPASSARWTGSSRSCAVRSSWPGWPPAWQPYRWW